MKGGAGKPHGEAFCVTGFDESAEFLWRAVAAVNCHRKSGIVPPETPKFLHRHKLDCREPLQAARDTHSGAFLREGAAVRR